MRARITVRGDDTELRGYVEIRNLGQLQEFSDAMRPYGLVVASLADGDYDPFWNWDPEGKPDATAN